MSWKCSYCQVIQVGVSVVVENCRIEVGSKENDTDHCLRAFDGNLADEVRFHCLCVNVNSHPGLWVLVS